MFDGPRQRKQFALASHHWRSMLGLPRRVSRAGNARPRHFARFEKMQSYRGDRRGTSAMKALNGWQRIGIVLSVLWAIVGFFWGNSIAIDALGRGVSASYARCLEQRSVQPDGSVPKDTDWKPCQVAFERDWGPAVKDHWSYAAASAFIPILIA